VIYPDTNGEQIHVQCFPRHAESGKKCKGQNCVTVRVPDLQTILSMPLSMVSLFCVLHCVFLNKFLLQKIQL
jgi:hypothetical protein